MLFCAKDILKDPEASDNDRFVAHTMLMNQVVSAEGELPTCQDTGTAIVLADLKLTAQKR